MRTIIYKILISQYRMCAQKLSYFFQLKKLIFMVDIPFAYHKCQLWPVQSALSVFSLTQA